MVRRSLIGFACLGALALTPASAQRDPLAPMDDSQPVPPTATQSPRQPRLVPVVQPSPAAVQPSPVTGFEAYKARLAALARASGVREATIQAVLPSLTINARVVQLDRSQPGGIPDPRRINEPPPPFAPYRRQHVTADLIQRGAARFSALWPHLYRIEQRYGVEPQVLMAIYGHETSYGRITGNFDLIQALATLAYEGRRRSFFEEEFVAALRLLDVGYPRWRLRGSWAGATGYPQFMPSNVLRLRADGDGDNYADLWSNEADALASIANYLRDAGWKPNVHWGIPVQVPASLNRQAIAGALNAPRCPQVFRRHSRWLTVREWRALGVVTIGRSLPDTELASLLEPDGPNATAYLLTTNYRAILDYNCSNFYALSVGLLADGIARR
ncbi:lytic murein transglycosylase [Sphingomonas arenae]|uniref:lytic murein transglycosylase n=1 Tax=Sphingomonas arenae TaxID=2812555 RepID=UPI003013EBA2